MDKTHTHKAEMWNRYIHYSTIREVLENIQIYLILIPLTRLTGLFCCCEYGNEPSVSIKDAEFPN